MILESQRVLLIGGTSGMGLATAHAAAAEGAQVIVASSRQSSIDAALQQLPDGSTGFVADMADPDGARRLIEQVGELDHLVYTAGDQSGLMMPISDYDVSKVQALLGVRFFGSLAAIKAAAPRIRTGGSITLTSGQLADIPAPGMAVASAAAAAAQALVRSLAVELAPIRVNVVSPGLVRSNAWDALPDDQLRAFLEQQEAQIPLGRVGTVEDAARAYLYAMTQRYATGTVIRINGGSAFE